MEDVPKFWEILRSFTYPRTDAIVLQTKGIQKLYGKSINPSKMVILPNPISSMLSQFRDSNAKKCRDIMVSGVKR